ncbi:MAG: M23 family metallopeptidase [Phycisphaerales bacterium]|nr:M23 family metallopeptidase [Phycisphaerales bacterium]
MIKYYFNHHTLKYEKIETSFRQKTLKVVGYALFLLTFSIILIVIFYFNFDSSKERYLKQQNADLIENYNILSKEVKDIRAEVKSLANTDNNIYRVIFDAEPIPDSQRIAYMERSQKMQIILKMDNIELANSIVSDLQTIQALVAYQQESYKQIDNMIDNKKKLLAATPSIQPISNKDLSRIASGFGSRIDPVYKIMKYHAGIDFAAPLGTPIYATANGVVESARFNTGGYGNNVIIDHSFGYRTLYGHMIKFVVRAGDKVKRGEIIGYVGSTGKSTGPHVHYEVRRKGIPVDPIYYFYNDLSPSDFDRVLELANSTNQSLD